MPEIFKLSKPLDTHGGPRHELELRDPKAKECLNFGMSLIKTVSLPNGTYEIKEDGDARRRWIAALSGLPTTDVDLLEPADLMDMIAWIEGKFKRAPEKNSE